MSSYKITIPKKLQPTNLADWLRLEGYNVALPCGGHGRCGKCIMSVNGILQKACQTTVYGGEVVEFTEQVETKEQANSQVLDSSIHYGLALDIGTTTLEMALLDLDHSKVLSSITKLNPQKAYGADVINRISACADGKLKDLQEVLLKALREMISTLGLVHACKMTVAGNTTMLHLFLGVDPSGMGAYPFTPAFVDTVKVKGSTLGLPIDDVLVLPSASAFIGADVLCGAFVSHMDHFNEPTLLLDLGTNGEMIYCSGQQNGSRFVATSTAAGPALEGGNISSGVGGVKGALSSFDLKDGQLSFTTIGDASPIGICGSGLIDLLSQLLLQEVVDETGYLDEDPYYIKGVHQTTNGIEKRDTSIALTQKDIRELQVAKAAIRAGVETLLHEEQYAHEKIAQVFLAGGLGKYIHLPHVMSIGMLPSSFEKTTIVVGNTALEGAIAILLDEPKLQELEKIAQNIKTVELNKIPFFGDAFVDYMMFEEE